MDGGPFGVQMSIIFCYCQTIHVMMAATVCNVQWRIQGGGCGGWQPPPKENWRHCAEGAVAPIFHSQLIGVPHTRTRMQKSAELGKCVPLVRSCVLPYVRTALFRNARTQERKVFQRNASKRNAPPEILKRSCVLAEPPEKLYCCQ